MKQLTRTVNAKRYKNSSFNACREIHPLLLRIGEDSTIVVSRLITNLIKIPTIILQDPHARRLSSNKTATEDLAN